MSQQAPVGGNPTTFNTNVNRAKTKKWVEAKSYSYDGDDWGDVDEYDEYGGYDEPEPQPAPGAKPTGLRQRGQSASQMPQDPYSARQDPYQSPVDTRIHGNTGGLSDRQQQHQYGSRSVTNPQPQTSTLRRTNSFDPEDERRAFSAGGPQPSMGNIRLETQIPSQPDQGQNIAAQDFQSGPIHPIHLPQGQPSLAQPFVHTASRSGKDQSADYDAQFQNQSELRQPDTAGRTQSLVSTNSTLDFHNRRDFSPSAMPPPLQPRGSPSPHSRPSPSHPPRKSSLSQETAPSLPFGAQAPPMTEMGDTEHDLTPAGERSASGAGKTLPFVRPADIYRRMQDEKEKERQSQESARPSMDAIMGKTYERSGPGRPQDSETSQQRQMPALDPVTERGSEYGIEGVNLKEHSEPEERRPTTSKKFELPSRKSNPGSQAASSSLHPMLPDVSRVSGFGESFFGSTIGSLEPSQEPFMDFARSAPSAPTRQDKATPEKDLRNQPSLGFTSAVHEAFDRAEDQVPPTPNSAAGSTVGRSTSGGTSVVSPIISRGPSAATGNWNPRLPGIDDVTTPTTVDAPEESSSRPVSSKSLGTPEKNTRKPSSSPATMPPPPDSPSPSFIPGHRRDLSTPSPDNSPARTPALEVNRHLRQPQEVELATATPTDPSFSANTSSNVSEVAEQDPISTQEFETASKGGSDNHVDTQPMIKNLGSPIPYPQNYLRTRTDSASSSRVRDLADKFESGSRPGSAHSATPRSSVFVNVMQKDDLVPSRPLADRMESFRPHLPGGWESSASIAPAAAFRRPEPSMDRIEPDSDTTTGGLAPSADQAPSSMSQIKDASEEAFTAVAAAGTALAGAFAAAVGMDQHHGPEVSTVETSSNEQTDERKSKDLAAATLKPNVPIDLAVNPEATKSYPPDPMDDEASTAAPSPLPKDTPLHRTEYSKTQGYFSRPENQEHPAWAGQSQGMALASRPSLLPSLSTEDGPQYESDRLRREIVRELSPMSQSEPTTAQSDYSNYEDTSRLSTNQSVPRPGHESGVLPREYENYWNDANTDDDTSQFSGEPGQLEAATTARRQQGTAVVDEPPRPLHVEQSTSPGKPLDQGLLQRDVPFGPTSMDEGSQDDLQVLQHRFSWEQPLQSPQPNLADPHTIHEVPIATVSDFPRSADSNAVHEVPDAPVSDFLSSAVYPEGNYFQPQDRPEVSQLSTVPNLADARENEDRRLFDRDVSVSKGQEDQGQHNEMAGLENEMPGHKPGLEVAPSSSEKAYTGPTDSGYDNSTNQEGLILQSDQTQDLELPLVEPSLPEPPVHESPRTLGTQDDELPPLPPPSTQAKIPAFREILALKSLSERIRAYDDTREQFANQNTGLAHWLAVTTDDLHEHGDLLTNSARHPNFQGHKPSPSRSKFGGLLQSGGHSSQPYSNNSQSAPQGAATSGALGNASPQGYSLSGGSSGKTSSQQVQAKGKDLLHTAGVFGGKANVAAKGLFSKGKSKLRGGGGAEKATPAPPQTYSPEPRGMQRQTRNIEARPTIRTVSRDTTTSNVQDPQDLRADFYKSTAHPTIPIQQDDPVIGSNVDPESVAKDPPYQHVDPNKAVVSTSSQGYLPLGEPCVQESPRDTPSLESFTQSQEGDDEYSEESAPTNQENPPRPSSLYLKGLASQRQGRTPLVDPYVGAFKEFQTPRSATSSNKTPTQATFTDVGQPTVPARFPVTSDDTSIQHHRGAGPSSRSFNQPESDFSPQISSNTRRNQEPEAGPRISQDSEGTFHTVGSGDSLPEDSLPTPQAAQNKPAGLDPNTQVRADVDSPQFKTFLQKSPDSPTSAQHVKSGSLISDSQHHRVPSQDYSWRGPSIDSDLGRMNFDHPPSPLTPRQPTNSGAPEQRGRAGFIHYGIDHDFDRPGDTERSRSRSTSYSRQLPDRRSQDSRPSLDPNILEHPAFRAVAEGNGMPVQDYRWQLPRETELRPHQQKAEHMLTGAGPGIGRRSESKSRSRRGSRSSAFFKAFTSPSKSDHPPLPNAPDSQDSSSPRYSPAIGDRRNKRLSIFRSRSGNRGSGTGDSRSKENIAPRDTSPRDSFTHVVHQVNPTPPRHVGEETSSKGVSSKLSKKLQRASTSAKPEPDSGKKKRFSAIGTLFGGRKRQSSTLESKVPPRQSFQESPPIQTQQLDQYDRVEPQRFEQRHYEPPKEETIRPPREGYYAPGRLDGSPQAGAYHSPHSGPRRNEQAYSRAPDAPAYVQDSALRVRQLMSPVEQPQNAAVPRTSATFSQHSPQHSSSTSVPRSSTSNQTITGEAFPGSPEHQSKASVSSWTRFSTHARAKSRQEQAPPPSKGAESSPPPKPYAPAPPINNSPATGRRSIQEAVRSESPPPPPLPPKDDWHRPRPRDSSGPSPSRNNQQSYHSPSPSQSSPRPGSTQQRQSLPPLQTSVRNDNPRISAIGPGRMLTPEEKRKSRRLEIERSSIPIPPPSPARNAYEAEDDEPVMSATSFPGQMWQPSYAHWDE